jgi:hypothetical protein
MQLIRLKSLSHPRRPPRKVIESKFRREYCSLIKGGEAMKRFVRPWMVLCTIFGILLMIGPEITSAEEYFMIQGKVVGIYKDQLTVKGDNGETMYFAIGRKTVFVPTRQPGVDERVKVTYYLQRGGLFRGEGNVATQVEILSQK